MNFIKRQANHFLMPYITYGEWTLDTISKFPHEEFLSADTETKLYIGDNQITAEELFNITSKLKKPNQYIKDNVNVKAYAFMLSNGVSFALFQCIEDFLTACAMFNVKRVYWYNARFDFALFDYYLLNNEWNDITSLLEQDSKRYRRMPKNTYQNLIGDYGQRYQMRLWVEYRNRKSAVKVHNFKMLDICNVFGGGLDANLKAWNIKSVLGEDVRKLHMDYDKASLDNENDLMYMLNDTLGLHLLSIKIDEEMKELTGYSLFKGEFMTSGGLARKTLLKMLFKSSDKENLRMFKAFFPMTKEQDEDYRFHALYKGGIAVVNPYKVGIVQKQIYKYDSNSMYPDKMLKMEYPIREGKEIEHTKKSFKKTKGKLYLLYLDNFSGYLYDNMIPIYQNRINNKYEDAFREVQPIYIWYEELQELKNWYDLDYTILKVIEFNARKPKGIIDYINTFYTIKCTEKGAKKQGAKLLLNSAYGKLAQKIQRVVLTYKLNEDGISTLYELGMDIDEKQMLSVLVGSRVTCLSRVDLMKHIRDICKNNPKEYFVYCDTDSIHSLLPYDKCDDKEIGKYKCEGIFKYGLYLAPKTYILNDGEDFDVHCKGVNTNVVYNELKGKTFKDACKIFKGNRLFKCLCGLNVKGGKALVWLNKMIVKEDIVIDSAVCEEELVSENIY